MTEATKPSEIWSSGSAWLPQEQGTKAAQHIETARKRNTLDLQVADLILDRQIRIFDPSTKAEQDVMSYLIPI